MSCQVQINTINQLKRKDIIDNFSLEGLNRILDRTEFDKLNEKYTKFAKAKYPNLVIPDGELLFSINTTEAKDIKRSTYRRDAIYKTHWAVPNKTLFDKLQVEFDKAQPKNEPPKRKIDPNGQYNLFGLDFENPEQLEFELTTLNVVDQFLKNIGIEQRLVPNFYTNEGTPVEGALAAANFINGSVDVIEDLERRPSAWHKVPEEAAHWWYRLLRKDSSLKKMLWESHKTTSKRNELYNTQYGKLVKKPEDLTEEAIGQLIAEAIKYVETKKGAPADYNFLKAFIEWINKLLAQFKSIEEDPFEVAAMKILTSDTSDLMSFDEYKKLNDIIYFDNILDEQSVAPMDYTIIEDIGTPVFPKTDDATSKYYFTYRGGKESPKFDTKEELDAWVYTNIKQYAPRQKEKLQEVIDFEVFIERLLNQKYKKKTKFLKKTLDKNFYLGSTYDRSLPRFKINTDNFQITKELDSNEIKILNNTNDYFTIAPTLKVLPLILQKYRKNPIVLNEKLKVDGLKKQESEIIEAIKNLIISENPGKKTITAEELVNEVYTYLESNYLLGFANELNHLGYRINNTFNEVNGLDGPVEHNKISIRFNDTYHLKGGHFNFSPSAWGNLTYFYQNSNTKNAVLLHEIQNDQIEFLRGFKNIDTPETLYARYIHDLNKHTDEVLESIKYSSKASKTLHSYRSQDWFIDYVLANVGNTFAFSNLKNSLREKIDLHESNIGNLNTKAALDNLYTDKARLEDLMRRGGLKSLLSKQDLEEIKSIAVEINNEEDSSIHGKLDQFMIRTSPFVAKINAEFKTKYGVNKNIITAIGLVSHTQSRSGHTKITTNLHSIFRMNDNGYLKSINKEILNTKNQLLVERKQETLYLYYKNLIKLTENQYDSLKENIVFNQELLETLVDKEIANIQVIAGENTNLSDDQIKNNLRIMDQIDDAGNRISRIIYRKNILLKSMNVADALKEVRNMSAEEMIQRVNERTDELLDRAASQKEKVLKLYDAAQISAEKTLATELAYFTPLVHNLIQKHILNWGKDYPMYFSGFDITLLTQGDPRTALIYAGKEEVPFTKEESDKIKYDVAVGLDLVPSVQHPSQEEIQTAIKKLTEYKRGSEENLTNAINTTLRFSNKRPIETGAIYNALSQLSGVKLIWEPEIEGLKDQPGGYRVDLTNYNYTEPLLFGLDTSVKPVQESKSIEAFGIPLVDINIETLQDAKSKRVAEVLAEKLSLGLNIGFQNITPEKAAELTRVSPTPYNGEPAFYYAGTVYVVGDNVNINTVLHEFAHPVINGIRIKNRKLFDNLYDALILTVEGQQIRDNVLKNYPELASNEDMLKSEILTYGLQLSSVNKLTQKIQTEGFESVINKLLAAIKEFFRGIFGNKKGISSINENTTLNELGNMLLEDEIDLSEYDITEDDLIQYGKFVTERANELTSSLNKEALEKIINEWYAANQAILNRSKNFKTDKAIRQMISESIFGSKEEGGSKNLLPEAVSLLRSFQTITDTSRYSSEELMSLIVDAEDKQLKQLYKQARALVNSIDKIDIIAENMLSDLGKIYKEKNISARNTLALVNFYKQNTYAWKETIDMFNQVLRESGLKMDKDNLFYNVLNKINANLDDIDVLVSQIYKKNNIQFYIELTGPMNEFVQEEFKKNLGIAFKNAYTNTADREAAIVDFYNKVISQEDITDNLEELYKKGVPKDVLARFMNLYTEMVSTPEKIQGALTGHARDVSWFNRYMESYTSSNDPIVGSLALFIENQRTEITNDFMEESAPFLKALERLLPQINFNKLNVTQIQEMVTFEDTILYWDKETGKPTQRKIRTFLNEFGNGWRYAEDILEYNLAQARVTKDQEKIIAAREELRQFKKNYMWQEFVPEYYESDQIYDEIIEGYDAATSKRIAMEAYADRQGALEDYNNILSEHNDELSRFENYDAIQAAFRKFKQLRQLTYEDGSPKQDDPKKGIFDLSKAKLLVKVGNAKSKFYEFAPSEKSLETSYNEFINGLAIEGPARDTKEHDKKIKDWQRQNLTMRYDPAYAEKRKTLTTRLGELQSKMNLSFDIAGAYKEINDLVYTYRDELGQPIAPELGEEKIRKIKDLEQSIINFRESLARTSGLTQEELSYLNTLTAMTRKGMALTSDQKKAMIRLLEKQSKTGLNITEAAEFQSILSDLGDISEKVPTDYYMDALNFNLSRLNKPEVTLDKVDEYINSDEFQDLLDEDEILADWFEDNHVSKKRRDKDKVEIIFQPSYANRITVPTDKKYILTTKILDNETGETITFNGVPNARHSTYRVKNEFRTIPIGETWDNYVGKIIDNKGNYLPRVYNPGNKHSAVDAKFMNQRYFDLKRSNNAEFKLLEEIKKFHLGVQKGESNYSKLYLDMPRHALKAGDIFQAMQRGKLGERFKTFTDWKNQLVGKSVTDFERGYNYDAKNNLVNTDLKGNEITYVPVEGIYNLELENTDADVITGLFKYGMSIKTQGKLLESLPIVESIVSTLEDPANQPKNMDAYSKGIFNVRNLYQNPTKQGAQNNRLGQVRSLIEREYRGKQTASFEESNPKLAKWLDLIQGLSTRASLAVNIPSDLKNQFSGYMQSMIESIGGEMITTKDYAMAIPWATQAMITWASKDAYAVGPGSLTGQMIQRFDPTFTSQDKYGNSVSKSIVKDLFNGSWMYGHRKFGEMDVAVKLFGSFLHGQKINQVVNGKQVFIRYVDAFELDKEGIIKLKAGVDVAWDTKSVYHTFRKGETLKQIADKYNITVEELKKRNHIESEIQFEDGQEIVIAKSEKFKAFKNKLQGTSRRLFGAYDRFGQPEGNKFIAYRMFFFMRKWFTPMLVNRWGINSKTASVTGGGERYDWALGRYTKGYYINAFQTLVRLVKSKGSEMAYMTDQEKADLRRTMAEGMLIVISALIASMLLGFDPDDDDKWKKIKGRSGAINEENFNTYGFLVNHFLLLVLGVQAETSAFVPLPKIYGVNLGADDYVKMLTSTSTSWYNTVVLYTQILGDVLNFITFDDPQRYEKDQGPYWWQQKGSLKLWKRLFGVVGFTGGTGDVETVLKNQQASSSRYGGS